MVVVAQKNHYVQTRVVRRRTKSRKEALNFIAGSSSKAVEKQATPLVKQLGKDVRETIINKVHHTVSVPEEDITSMKSTCLWNKMCDICRWLGTFQVALAPEAKVKSTIQGWLKKTVCSVRNFLCFERQEKTSRTLVLYFQFSGVCLFSTTWMKWMLWAY